MNVLQEITQQYLRTDLPELHVGDKIEVTIKNYKPSEKDKFRLTHFKGIIISQKNKKQISYTFSVLKETNKAKIRSTFLYHSPFLISIKKVGRINQKVRRAKLYYLERK